MAMTVPTRALLLPLAATVLVLAACGSSTPRDGARQTYSCFPPPSDSGTATADAGQPATCVVGQTYCRALRPRGSSGPYSDCLGVPPRCASNPTCACIMPTPDVSCSCAEPDGLVVLTCDRI
jgi:hypothetical protein